MEILKKLYFCVIIGPFYEGIRKMKKEIEDIFKILLNKEAYNQEVFEMYRDELTSFQDLLGDNENKMSSLFYLINRHFLYMLDNDPKISIRLKDINFRRKFYNILKLMGPSMLGCKLVIEIGFWME